MVSIKGGELLANDHQKTFLREGRIKLCFLKYLFTCRFSFGVSRASLVGSPETSYLSRHNKTKLERRRSQTYFHSVIYFLFKYLVVCNYPISSYISRLNTAPIISMFSFPTRSLTFYLLLILQFFVVLSIMSAT